MAAQDSSSKGTTEFTLFPELPHEIQVMVWKRAFPGPRTVELQIWHKFSSEGYGTEGYFTSSCPIPITLSVCQASRRETLSEYELSFPYNGSSARVYFNSSIDILVLSWRSGVAHAENPLAAYLVFDTVEHVCITIRHVRFTVEQLGYALGQLDRDMMDAFPIVKSIILAIDEADEIRPGLLSIVEIEFTAEEQNLYAVAINHFRMDFARRHPDRKVPTIVLGAVKRQQQSEVSKT